jgi:hypothetical protein
LRLETLSRKSDAMLKVCPGCSVATETEGGFCPHCGVGYDRSPTAAVTTATAATTPARRTNGWAIVSIVLAIALVGVYLLARHVIQGNNSDLRDRLRGYTTETVECIAAGNSEAYCVEVYEP